MSPVRNMRVRSYKKQAHISVLVQLGSNCFKQILGKEFWAGVGPRSKQEERERHDIADRHKQG